MIRALRRAGRWPSRMNRSQSWLVAALVLLLVIGVVTLRIRRRAS
jgi:hypothetical protein